MGVLLRSESHTLLIDGLHEFYGPAYQYPSPEMVQDLLTEGGEYPIPDIVLATHHHRDHFSAKLYHQLTNSWVIGPKQVTDSLTLLDSTFIRVVPYGDYNSHLYQKEEISVNAFRMDHVNQSRHHQVQNIGFLIEMGSRTVLHVGDTDWHDALFQRLKLPSAIDIVILPVWMLLQQQSVEMIREYLNPRFLVVTHIDPRNVSSTLERIRSEFPEAITLTQLGETHKF